MIKKYLSLIMSKCFRINNFFYSLLVIKIILASLLLLFYGIGLSPDEAQYWLWSQSPDWGYYSKPPGIAWVLFLSTKLLGNTVFAIRFPAVLISSLLAYLMYRLMRQCGGSEKQSVWVGVIMAFTPIGILSSFASTTDGGFLCFWLLSCTQIVKNLRNNEPLSIPKICFFIACGLLFKWTMVLMILPLFFFKGRGYFKGVLFIVVGFLPSVIWNSQHDWVTFKHVFYHNMLGGSSLTNKTWKGNFWDFFGVQFAILSPVFFILLLYSYYHLFRRRVERHWKFCGIWSVVILGGYLIASIFTKIQPNWALFALPTGLVWMVYCADQNLKKMTLYFYIGITSSLLLCSLVLSVPYLQRHNLKMGTAIPWKWNVFRHQLGWERLEPTIKNESVDFLFCHTYQMVSLVSFYSPKQEPAFFFNLEGRRKNQFDFWEKPAWSTEDTGLFIAYTEDDNIEFARRNYLLHLGEYFENVDFIGDASLFNSYGHSVKKSLSFRCKGFRGIYPEEVSKY
jgi:hypothetical protein